MKKILFYSIVALVAMSAVSCNKNVSSDAPSIQEGRTAHVTFSLKAGSTVKANTSKTATEKQVNTFDAFVFNATGDLDAYGHYTTAEGDGHIGTVDTDKLGNDVKRLECTTGAGKRIYILVNYNEAAAATLSSAITTEAQFQALTFSLLKNQSVDPAGTLNNFEMIGYATKDFTPGEVDVPVTVESVVARVELKKITKNFTSDALAGALTIKGVYMTNVVGEYGIGASYDGDVTNGVYKAGSEAVWHNKYAWDSTDPYVPSVAWPYPGKIDFSASANLFLKGVASDFTIAEDASNNTAGQGAHVFYVMPNNVPWGVGEPAAFGPVMGSSWSPRHTKLVVEVEYAGKRYYYPIPIAENGMYPIGDAADLGAGYAGIKANRSYEIDELVLTRLGSTNPDEPVNAANVEFQITVADWEQVLVATEEGKYVI